MEVGERNVLTLVRREINMGYRKATRDTYNYQLKQHNKKVYEGVTCDCERREREHRASDKVFTHIVCKPVPCSRETAIKREQDAIRTYERNHGKPPKYNKTCFV